MAAYKRTTYLKAVVALAFLSLLYIYYQPTTRPSSVENPHSPESFHSQDVPHSEKSPRIPVAIVTFITNERSYVIQSLRNKNSYAKKHNYTLVVDFETDRDLRSSMWHKLNMIERLIHGNKHDWIWWIDFDTLVTNGNIRLEDIIADEIANTTNPNDIELLLTPDCFPLNAGSMMVRSSQRALDFLNRVRKYGDAHQSLNEQECIRDLLQQDYGLTKASNGREVGWASQHVKFIPQIRANAFPEEIRCWEVANKHWEPGYFLVHFAGAWAHVEGDDPTGQLMEKYGGLVEGLP